MIFNSKRILSTNFLVFCNNRNLIKKRLLTCKKYLTKLSNILKKGSFNFKLIFFRYLFFFKLEYLYKKISNLKKGFFFFNGIFSKFIYSKLSRCFIKKAFLTSRLGYIFSLPGFSLVKNFLYVNQQFFGNLYKNIYVDYVYLNSFFVLEQFFLFEETFSSYGFFRYFKEVMLLGRVRFGLLLDSFFDYFSNILRDKMSFTYVNPFLLNYVMGRWFYR